MKLFDPETVAAVLRQKRREDDAELVAQIRQDICHIETIDGLIELQKTVANLISQRMQEAGHREPVRLRVFNGGLS